MHHVRIASIFVRSSPNVFSAFDFDFVGFVDGVQRRILSNRVLNLHRRSCEYFHQNFNELTIMDSLKVFKTNLCSVWPTVEFLPNRKWRRKCNRKKPDRQQCKTLCAIPQPSVN